MLFSHVALSPAAALFSQLHPQLQIEINAEDRFVDPVEEDYDLVIRTNPKPTESMVGRRLFTDELALVAAPTVTRPLAGGPVDAVLMSRAGEVRDWLVDAGDGPVTYHPQPVMRLSSILMIHQAVQAGRGAAILPWSLVDGDVASGRLANWDTSSTARLRSGYCMPPRGFRAPRSRALLRFLPRSSPMAGCM